MGLYLPGDLEDRGMTDSHEVFVSYGKEDAHVARVVAQFLADKGKRVFFAGNSHSADFSQAIDEALDSATCLIGVATRPEHLKKRWTRYEIRGFHREILDGIKPLAIMLSYIAFPPACLELPLRHYRAIQFAPADPLPGLKELWSSIVAGVCLWPPTSS